MSVRAEGQASVYSLAPPALPALPALQAAAGELLAATGKSVAPCPDYGQLQ